MSLSSHGRGGIERSSSQFPNASRRGLPSRSFVAVFGALALVIAACSDPGVDASAGPLTTQTATSALQVEAAAEPKPDEILNLVASLSTDQKIGQLLMPVVAGRDATDVSAEEAAQNVDATGFRTPAEIVDAYQLGGVIYLPSNIDSAEQVRTFSADLQAVARAATGTGLLVAVDQEGGRVNRITDQVTVFPSAEELAGDAVAVHEASYVTGQQLQRQGFNVVLAPVADVVDGNDRGFIGDRSYGTDPAIVSDMVAASVSGLQQAGVAAAAKHWPGHGATPVDSHQDLPTLNVGRPEWDQREKPPFEAAIASDVAIVLVGHLTLPNLDQTGTPATVSPILIDGLLRGELGFEGVVMTDALNMGAVSAYDEGELAVRAVLAGADILLVPPDLARARAALQQAVSDGRISAAHLDVAAGRILRLKQDLGVLNDSQ